MPQGSLSHIGLGKETTFGTPVAASDYIRFASETLTETIEQVKSSVMQGVFDDAPSQPGISTIAGDIQWDVYPDIAGVILRSTLGAPATTMVETGVYQHVFTPSQTNFATNCALPPYTLEVHRDLGQAWQYTGVVFDQADFTFGTSNKIMGCKSSVIAKGKNMIAATSPTFETADPFVWTEAVVSLNGVNNTNISTFEFQIQNALEGIPTLDGTKNINRILRNGPRTFPIKFTVELQDMTEYNLFLAQNEIPITITFTGGTILDTHNYSMEINIPKFHFNTFPINVSGAGVITAQVDGWAQYDPTNGFGAQITLVNDRTAY